MTTCLRGELSTFWSAQLNAAVSEPVVLHPLAAQVPRACRSGLVQAPAFTCPSNRTLYLTDAFLQQLQADFPGSQLAYALAVVQAHEMGHVVQLQVHQPQLEDPHPTAAEVRFSEQQADCLSGVWAHGATDVDPSTFRAVAARVLTGISTAREIATHGTPAQRVAAIDRGLQGGRPQSCQLRTFS